MLYQLYQFVTQFIIDLAWFLPRQLIKCFWSMIHVILLASFWETLDTKLSDNETTFILWRNRTSVEKEASHWHIIISVELWCSHGWAQTAACCVQIDLPRITVHSVKFLWNYSFWDEMYLFKCCTVPVRRLSNVALSLYAGYQMLHCPCTQVIKCCCILLIHQKVIHSFFFLIA